MQFGSVSVAQLELQLWEMMANGELEARSSENQDLKYIKISEIYQDI